MTRRGLTADARRALADAGFSRRAFLQGSGAVIVTFASAGLPDVFAQGFNGTGSTQLDSWIAIGADGMVTAYTGKCELRSGSLHGADATRRRGTHAYPSTACA